MTTVIIKAFKWQIIKTVIFGTAGELFAVTNLFFTSFFISWLQSGTEKWLGFVYALVFCMIFYIQQLNRVYYFFWANQLGINIRKAVSGLMFKKALKFSQKSKAISSTGRIVTIVSSELQSIDWGIQFAPYIVVAPISTLFAFALIAINFEEAAIIGFGVFIAIMVAQFLISKATVGWKTKEGYYSDKRVDLIKDIVNGIRTIKIYGWELPFQDLIKKYRNSQLLVLLKSHISNSTGNSIFQNGGLLMAIAIFGYHFGREKEFSYSRSLSTLAILGYLSMYSCYFLFVSFNWLANMIALLKRTGEVIGMEECRVNNEKEVTQHPSEIGVKLENASISWGFSIKKKDNKADVDQTHKDINLKNINLEAKSGELIAIVGSVGCGKSTLLTGIMQELEVVEGNIFTKGSKAYVEQEPFIISGTVKENIIFGSDFNEKLFNEVVEVCCLAEDLDQMQYGAETIIGERGINISGGQKARISLARAVYSDSDIYLLDDPLSAVDPEVASKLFNNCISGYLKDKWRILVTHQIQFLKNVDMIYLIEQNQIKMNGTYSDFSNKGMNFDEVLKEYNKKEEKKEDEFIIEEESTINDKDALPPIKNNIVSKIENEITVKPFVLSPPKRPRSVQFWERGTGQRVLVFWIFWYIY